MYIGKNFIFDNISSQQFDAYLVGFDSKTETTLGAKRSLKEETINNTSCIYDVEEEPLTLNLVIYKNKWTLDDNRKIINWLFKNDYKRLEIEGNEGLIYNAIAIGDPRQVLNNVKNGYCTITFRCDSPYGYSPTYQETYDFSTLTVPKTFTINNISNVNGYNYPEIEFELGGSTTEFSIINMTNAGENFKFTNLQQGEKVYVNNQYKRIISSTGLYRISNFNKKWLRTINGINIIKVETPCKITIKQQYAIMQ